MSKFKGKPLTKSRKLIKARRNVVKAMRRKHSARVTKWRNKR